MALLPKSVNTTLKFPRKAFHVFKTAPVGTIRRRVLSPIKQFLKRSALKSIQVVLSALDMLAGPQRANRIFWSMSPDSSAVFMRIRKLKDAHPDQLPLFAKSALLNTHKPDTLLALARSDLSQDVLRDELRKLLETGFGGAWRDIKRSHRRVAGISICVSFLLTNEEQKNWAEFLKKSSFVPNPSYISYLDSVSFSPSHAHSGDHLRWLPQSKFSTPACHRLIITSCPDLNEQLALLCNGAEKVTVYSFHDLYGKLDLSEFSDHFGSKELLVEHARSRISRFSETYHRLHEETREAAETIVGALCSPNNKRANFLENAKPYLELSLADALFFPALKRESLEVLLADSKFDHIVIASAGAGKDMNMVDHVFSCDGLTDDPRVEFVFPEQKYGASTSPVRWLEQLYSKKQGQDQLGCSASFMELDETLMQVARTSVASMSSWQKSETANVFLASSSVGAYNSSTKEILEILNEAFTTKVAFLDGNTLSLFGSTSEIPDDPDLFLQLPNTIRTLRGEYFEEHLKAVRRLIPQIKQPALRRVLRIEQDNVVWSGLVWFLFRYALFHAWFTRQQKQNKAPDAVVMTPFRTPIVAAFAGISKDHDIPTLAVEPHGLNAAYCRYSKISADHYGVVSRYFIQAAEEGFGVPAKFSHPIGSPRLKAPAQYDREARVQVARDEYRSSPDNIDLKGNVITFFSQPALWEPVEAVWRMVCAAAAEHDFQICLKMHPEEGDSQRRGYIRVIDELGLAHRFTILAGNATQAIEASDLVISRYSATVFETALLRKPVFCVTDGEGEYPLNQHDIIDAPFFRDVESLSKGIGDFLANPTPFHKNAERFLAQEPQLITGPKGPLLEALNTIMETHKNGTFDSKHRNAPKSLFLDGPHEVFEI